MSKDIKYQISGSIKDKSVLWVKISYKIFGYKLMNISICFSCLYLQTSMVDKDWIFFPVVAFSVVAYFIS